MQARLPIPMERVVALGAVGTPVQVGRQVQVVKAAASSLEAYSEVEPAWKVGGRKVTVYRLNRPNHRCPRRVAVLLA